MRSTGPGGLTVLTAPTLDEIRAAAVLLAPHVVRTPLLRLDLDGGSEDIYLKPENLQPTGAFKVRPIVNVMLSTDKAALRNGVYTTSSGNAGRALAWIARQLGVPATVYASESAQEVKLEPIRALGARVERLADDRWWEAAESGAHAAASGFYVDAVRDRFALAGNGTIGLEILEQMPDVDTIVAPFGGGGVSSGIAAAIRGLKPEVRVIAAESDAAAPATAAFREGRPVTVPVQPSFISGTGAPSVLAEMWPLIRNLVNETAVVPVASVADAIRLLFEHNRIVAEGAGALSVAAALADRNRKGKTVCVVTGGNIDRRIFSDILRKKGTDLFNPIK